MRREKGPGRLHRLRRHLRVAAALVLLVLILAGAVLIKVAASGLPPSILRRLEESLSTKDVTVRLEDVRVYANGSAQIHAVQIFRAGGILPDAEVFRAKVLFDWDWDDGLKPRIRRIEAGRVVLRDGFWSDATAPDSSNESATSGDLPVFGQTKILVGELETLGIHAGRVRVILSSDGEKLDLDEIRAYFSPDECVEGTTWIAADGRCDVRLHGDLVPSRLNPALRVTGLGNVADIFDDFALPDGPARADFRLVLNGERRHLLSHVRLANGRYHDVPVLGASATIRMDGTEANGWDGVHVEALDVRRPEGRATADLFFDFRRHGIVVDAISTLDFPHLAQIIGILSFIPWDTYETSGDRAEAHGFYAFSMSDEPTSMGGRISTGSFSFRRRVPVRDVSSEFRIDGETYRFPNIRGRLYGGDGKGSVTLSYDERRHLWADFETSVTNADFTLVAQDLFKGWSGADGGGTVDLSTMARFDASATNSLRTMEGSLSGRIRDAQLYQTPLFAGLTDFMVRNVPGIGDLVTQEDLDVEAEISDNGLHFTDLHVDGPLFSIAGDGHYWFTDYVDLGVKVHLLRHGTWVGQALRVVLYPVSKLFEMEATGPVSNVSWSPTTLSLSRRSKATDEQKYGPVPAEGGE